MVGSTLLIQAFGVPATSAESSAAGEREATRRKERPLAFLPRNHSRLYTQSRLRAYTESSYDGSYGLLHSPIFAHCSLAAAPTLGLRPRRTTTTKTIPRPRRAAHRRVRAAGGLRRILDRDFRNATPQNDEGEFLPGMGGVGAAGSAVEPDQRVEDFSAAISGVLLLVLLVRFVRPRQFHFPCLLPRLVGLC